MNIALDCSHQTCKAILRIKFFQNEWRLLDNFYKILTDQIQSKIYAIASEWQTELFIFWYAIQKQPFKTFLDVPERCPQSIGV